MKGIAGFYYVYVEGCGIYECKAKGVFRSQKKKPLVGDDVEIEALDERKKTGNMVAILPRGSEMFRPAVANADQALVIFAAAKPRPSLSLLDRFLVTLDLQGIRSILCFNKKDEASADELLRLQKIYAGCHSPVAFISAKYEEGLEDLKKLLLGHTTAVAGPSGVGKSTLINRLVPGAMMQTREISEKIERGRHTTRHSELFRMEAGSYLFDTPGFSSLDLESADKETLRFCFPEFKAYEGKCRFQGCAHMKEPGCAVKAAVLAGEFSGERYESYARLYENLHEREKRRHNG